MPQPYLPSASKSIAKGVPLKDLLGDEALTCLAHNILLVYPAFDAQAFRQCAQEGLMPLGILERARHLARALRRFLPPRYSDAIEVLLASLTPPLTRTDELGLAVLFYLPHVFFVATYGLDPLGNGGEDPFALSMQAQYALTKRFSAEFSMRPFLLNRPTETLSQLLAWCADPDPHVRRLCSEGARPRLPWAAHIAAFIANPELTLPILEALKDDPDLYVRRSVANHLGDIAKDHPQLVFAICRRWLQEASGERKWLIRHALRHPAKMGDAMALQLRAAAK